MRETKNLTKTISRNVSIDKQTVIIEW